MNRQVRFSESANQAPQDSIDHARPEPTATATTELQTNPLPTNRPPEGVPPAGHEERGEEESHGGPENIEKKLQETNATRNGLTTAEAETRKAQYGPNSLPEKKKNPVLLFFSFMWNPLSWAMEIAAILSIILLDYADFGLILGLLLLNSTIGFWEEHSAGNAIAALKAQLSPSCKALRDGELKKIDAADLVPGDVVLLRLGDIVPADCILLEGEGLKIDQSSLTGESLPVDKHEGDEAYSGSIIKQGEVHGLVYATGVNTFFGKAASLVQSAESSGHFQRVLRNIGLFCIALILFFVILEFIFVFGIRQSPCPSVADCPGLENAIVLIVGGIPIAMPTVLSVTMAVGAQQLAKKQAIVSRLTAVEELAGMDILCSDKTGTLTKNKLTVADPIGYGGLKSSTVIFQGSLASKPETEDAIDIAIVEHLTDKQIEKRKLHETLYFRPFDPISKKAIARLRDDKGMVFHVEKGAPQVILSDALNKDEIEEQVEQDIDMLARRGYRSLGVAVSDEEGKDWIMTGIIPMFDPPRDDTADTIKRIQELGVRVKMITGDQLAIAKETARLLGMGQSMYYGKILDSHQGNLDQLVLEADGFAQVFPENKYAIVDNLQRNKHIVGMTGDGVNDAPALKKADIGIAVAGATDAARAASDIVLTSPGLSVIADAIIGSRKIFQRMKNYCTYSVMAVIRIVFTFGLLTLIFNFFFPTIAVVILAILNDVSMITISKDRVKPSPTPDHWDLVEIYSIAVVLGLYLAASTIVLFVLVLHTNFFQASFGLPTLDEVSVTGLIYLQVSITNLGAIFVTRSQSFFFLERPGTLVLVAFVIAQIIASVLGAYGLNGYTGFQGSGWGYVLVAWIWSIIWFVLLDPLKIIIRRFFRDRKNPRATAEEKEKLQGKKKSKWTFWHHKKQTEVKPPQAAQDASSAPVPVLAPQATATTTNTMSELRGANMV